MQRHGRTSQIILELTVAWGIAVALALTLPFAVWQSLGQTGAALAVLTYATAITALVSLRRRPQPVEMATIVLPLRKAA
jgi:hypothetical protein